jgi:DivIVA domain-containing protein
MRAEAAVMTGMSPEDQAWYALDQNLPRGDLSMAAQLEYDRLRPAWEREEARPGWDPEAARLAWEREHPPEAHERRGSWLVTRPGCYARPVTGDQIRDTMFLTAGVGYDVAQVDDLLRRVAAELDAGRPVEPLIRNTAFRTKSNGYKIDAVDWFLGQILFCPAPAGAAEMSADPWRDLGVVAQFARSGVEDPAQRSVRPSRRGLRKYYSEKCSEGWHDFDTQPGVHLRLEWAGAASRELLTMEAQTIASMSYTWFDMWSSIWSSAWELEAPIAISTRDRSLILAGTDTARSSSPAIAKIAAWRSRDSEGHFCAETRISQSEAYFRKTSGLRELVDETSIPVLYTGGWNFDHRALARILFPDQRWLRFPVRGTRRSDAIMTAVDEAGNSVVRYRIISSPSWPLKRHIVEITVHPGWELTEELVLAIAISAPWLSLYFSEPGGGG